MGWKPRIGINGDMRREESEIVTLATSYADSVVRAGGVPVILPALEAGADIPALLDGVDGVILSGGADYDPGVYGCVSTPAVRRVHPRREGFDLRLARLVLERGIPVLGICCGAQLLSIARGGSLHVDIGDDFPDGLDHRERAGRATHHEVEIEEGSLLEEIFGRTRIRVNSKHHQAVRVAGEGLRISGRAPDGVPEAIEGDDGFVLGVQWHPELMQGDPHQERLFRALVERSVGGGRR